MDLTSTQGIVFDKDGTLFDFARTWEAFAYSVLRQLSEDANTAKMLGKAVGFDMEQRQFRPDSVVIAGTPREIADAMAPHLPGRKVPELIDFINEEAAHAPQAEAVPLIPFLDDLRAKSFKLGVATNDGEAPARAHLGRAGIIEKFDFIAGFDSGFGGKPAAGQLMGFCDATGLSPDCCMMVGDSLHDLRAGRAAGFMTVGVLTGMADEKTLAPWADAVVPDIGHLPALLSS